MSEAKKIAETIIYSRGARLQALQGFINQEICALEKLHEEEIKNGADKFRREEMASEWIKIMKLCSDLKDGYKAAEDIAYKACIRTDAYRNFM